MSQQYISVDGHNISFTSSGYRLIATLVTSLLDEDYNIFLIDEPELGVSPEAQGYFSDFLFDRELRKEYFPHMNTLIIATHSTIFLDRNTIQNNFFVEKNGDSINIERVNSLSQINKIHFFLLGNRFESLYLPSAIIIVEGKTDHAFFERIFSIRYPDKQLSLLNATSDTRVKEILNICKSLLGDMQKSPYKDLIYVVLDQQHSRDIIHTLERMGLPEENIIEWSKNGIEFYYPRSIMKEIFGSEGAIEINGDRVRVGDMQYSKTELSSKVIQRLDEHTEYEEELTSKLLWKLDTKL